MGILDRHIEHLSSERGLAERSISTYVSAYTYITRITGKRFTLDPVGQRLTVDDMKLVLRSGYSPASKKVFLGAAKVWEKWCDYEGIYPANGILHIPTPKVKRTRKAPLTRSQARTLLNEASDPGEVRVVFLGLFEGPRLSEQARIGPDSVVDPDHLEFLQKGGTVRRVCMHPEVKAVWGTINDLDLPALTPGQLNKVVMRMRERVGIYFTTHALRRTFTQSMLDRGTPLEVVQEAGGWIPTSTTLRHYGKVPERLTDAAVLGVEY